MDTTQTPAEHTRPSATEEIVSMLIGPALFALAVGIGFLVWHHDQREHERETETWLHEVMLQHDPWQRHAQLDQGFGRVMSDSQRQRALEERELALEQALAAGTEAAFELVETQKLDELLDKYPRDPARRQLQLNSLAIVWPDIANRAYKERMSLVRAAARCHLHEAAPPVTRKTVVDCVRFGSQSLGGQADLARLMDNAILGEPLTGATR